MPRHSQIGSRHIFSIPKRNGSDWPPAAGVKERTRPRHGLSYIFNNNPNNTMNPNARESRKEFKGGIRWMSFWVLVSWSPKTECRKEGGPVGGWRLGCVGPCRVGGEEHVNNFSLLGLTFCVELATTQSQCLIVRNSSNLGTTVHDLTIGSHTGLSPNLQKQSSQMGINNCFMGMNNCFHCWLWGEGAN